MISIPAIDPVLLLGPCRWQSRDNRSFPQVGDECLAVQDENDEWWILAWWPDDPTFPRDTRTTESATPPSNPRIGDQWAYHPQIGLTWTLRYEPEQSATYPWMFLGGPPFLHEVGMGAPQACTTFSVWQDLATVGPTFTVVRPGVYHLRTIHWFQNAFADWASGHMGVMINGNPPPSADHTKVNCHFSAGGHASASWDRWVTVAADDVLLCRYFSANVNSNAGMTPGHLSHWSRRLYVTPLRIA